MNYLKFSLIFSHARSNRYLISSDHVPEKAIELYKFNLKLAKSFHPLLGILEVVLRNKLDIILSKHFNDKNWIINEKNGFMANPILPNKYKKTVIEKTEKKLNQNEIPITCGKILAEQSFGFWTDFYEVSYYKLLKGKPIYVFSDKPKQYGRKEIHFALNTIRRFRNRINHNEPICFSANKIDMNFAKDVYQSLINLISWIDKDLIIFIKELDDVEITIANINSQFNSSFPVYTKNSE